MKKTLLLIISISVLLSGYAFAEKVTLGNGEWKPYQSKDLKEGGFCTDVVKKAFKKAGIDTEFKWYGDSWKRAYFDAKNNTMDGTLVWAYKKERADEMYYSKGAVLSGKKDYIFFLKSGKQFNTPEDIKGSRMGGVLGYTYGDKVDALINSGEIKIQRTDSDNVNVKKLLLGRIDCLIAGEKLVNDLLAKNFSPEERAKVTKSSQPVNVVTYHLLLNKKNPANKAIMDRFDTALESMMVDGTYQDLVNKLDSGGYGK
jgi:polar amino acid transport system substrate-binding protein